MGFSEHLLEKVESSPITVQTSVALLVLGIYLSSSRCRAFVRTGLFALSVILCSTWGILISAYYGIETNYHATLFFARVCEWTIGLRLQVEGKEHLDIGPSVVIYNHQSSLDIVFIGRSMPRRAVVMAKKELRWTPFFGQYLIFSKALFLDRKNNKTAVASLQSIGEKLLAQKASLIAFPEGTRSLSRHCELKEFKKGAFHVAIASGIPIVPVVFENQWKIYRPGTFDGGRCRVRVLEPIPTTGLTTADASDLAARAREKMLEALKDISQT